MRTMKAIVASITAPLKAALAFDPGRPAFAVLLIALLAAPASAQINLTGDWTVTIQSPLGTNTATVTLTQDGEKLSGLLKSPLGELPVTGALTGDDLTIAFTMPVQGQSFDVVMTGKVEGPTLTGKVQFGGLGEGDWTANRAELAESPTTPTTTPGVPGGASGTWDLTFKTPNGYVQATATINQEGGTVSGILSSPMGDSPVTGTLEGTALRVTSIVVTPRGALPITMTGYIVGDAIAHGKAEVPGVGKMKFTGRRKE